MKKIAAVICILLYGIGLFSQENKIAIENHIITLPQIINKYRVEDTCSTCLIPYGKKYIIDECLDGWYFEQNDSNEVYTIQIKTTGSIFLDVIFKTFIIRDGCTLEVMNDKNTLWTFDYKSSTGVLSKAVTIAGDNIQLKYTTPQNYNSFDDIVISSITYVYDEEMLDYQNLDESLPCHIDVNCPEGDPYRDIIRSVVLIRNLCDNSGDCSRCSGSLLNNTNEDFTPYILTAHHCVQGEIEDNLDEAIFKFNYQASVCDGNPPINYFSNDYDLVGANLRAQRTAVMGSDFALLELYTTPPLYFNTYYSGWSREGSLTGSDVEGIHHPLGDPKKISFGHVKGLSLADYINVEWDDGTVEDGSSGSPIYKGKKVVGQLSGGWGNNDCSNLGDDLYGHFASSWGSTWGASRRLRDWLDPPDYDPDSWDGKDPQNECTPILNLSGVYPRTDYQPEAVTFHAANSINISELDIESDGYYIFKAGNNILITPETQVFLGSNVHFTIQNCTTKENASILEYQKRDIEMRATLDYGTSSDQSSTISESVGYHDDNISIYPNPNNGHFWIQVPSDIDTKISLKVMTAMGTCVYHAENIRSTIVKVDISSMESGLYVVKIYSETDELLFTEKLVIN